MSKGNGQYIEKTVKLSSRDKPWINTELKVLDRKKQREYTKNGKSPKYIELARKFNKKYKAAAKKYLRGKWVNNTTLSTNNRSLFFII